MTLAPIAALLGADEVVDAGPRWTNLPGAADGAVVWGRAPAPSGTSWRDALAHARRREAALRRVDASVTRWRPPDLGGSRARNALRAALLGGAVAEIGRAAERPLDAAAAAAGAVPPASFRPASGGGILARVDVDGAAALLRAGLAGGPGDPAPGAGALGALGGHRLVPRPLGHGVVAGASWSAEALLPGRRPGRVTSRLWDACVDLCAALPRAAAPEAPRADLDAVAAAVPEARRAEAALDRLDGLGGAARHGDLWRPNLLAAGGRLTGVVDWDAWHPVAAPGTDLLNLYATERHGPGIGAAWQQAPWRSPAFAAATRRYWDALGVAPSPGELDAVAVAWWAGHVAATLRRLPHLAGDAGWLDANVRAVVRTL